MAARHSDRIEPPADPITGLEQPDADAGLYESSGRGETADPAADHDHLFSLASAPHRPEATRTRKPTKPETAWIDPTVEGDLAAEPVATRRDCGAGEACQAEDSAAPCPDSENVDAWPGDATHPATCARGGLWRMTGPSR